MMIQTIPKITLNERLKALRKAYQFTLKDLSRRTGLSVSYLSDIERGRTLPSLKTCQKLADVYGLTVSIMLSIVDKIGE